MTIYAVRVTMIDGSSLDVLQFLREQDAEQHAEYVRSCHLFGFEKVCVIPKLVIGKG